jgi:hypothetical protein
MPASGLQLCAMVSFARASLMEESASCVLWRLVGITGEALVCYLVHGTDGLAVTIERRNEIVNAEMVTDLDAAVGRADVLRERFMQIGMRETDE